MKHIVNKALLFAALFIVPSIYCIDGDIFKEMVTFSTSVEAQEHPAQNEVSDECVWASTIECRAHIRAYRNASQDEIETKKTMLKKCLFNTACARAVKKGCLL